MLDEFDFSDLAPQEIPVKVGKEAYTLGEISTAGAIAYRGAAFSCFRYDSEGNGTQIQNLTVVEPVLVAYCLRDKDGKEVSVDTVRGWGHRIVNKLFRKAKLLNPSLEIVSKERNLLEQALAAEGSPITLQELRAWVGSLDPGIFKDLQDWLEPVGEEALKNV